ncbi:MAG: HAD family hydrolase [Ferruginibacter sp.]
MNLSGIKLVAADMDGTLLNSKHELSPKFYPLFNEMRSKGLLFAAASGRQYYNLVNVFKAIEDQVIFIAENGSYVVYKGEELLVQAMTHEITMEQLAKAKQIPGVYPILCGKKKAYVEDDDAEFIKNVEMYYDEYVIVPELLKVTGDEFLKIALCDFGGAEKNSYNHFKQEVDHLQVKISGSVWLDISHKLANKGRAIEVLQRKYNITQDETMVFGDYLNDLEMMKAATYSFAMENAHADIKEAARFSAKNNNEDGVIEVLEQMMGSINSPCQK